MSWDLINGKMRSFFYHPGWYYFFKWFVIGIVVASFLSLLSNNG